MKRGLKFIVGGLVLGAAYLLFWPVPISPVEWNAPVSEGYSGPFAPNTDLSGLERISIGATYGPEDVDIWEGEDGLRVYASGHKGEIIEINPVDKSHKIIANTGGVPLGVEFGPDGVLYVADAHKGLLAVTRQGDITLLTDSVAGTPIDYADDLDIGPDGIIYFSDASTKFGAKNNKSTLSASLLEIIEHRGTGRVLAYDPKTKTTSIIKTGFVFSNGVAMHADGQSLLVNETGTYSVHRIWVSGPRKGESEIFIDNMPGFPDNINPGPVLEGVGPTHLLGLISMRSQWLDDNAKKSLTRKIAMRLPAFMRPKAVDYGHIVQLDGEGNVIKTWQDPSGDFPGITGAIIAPDGYMYVSSLTAKTLARKRFDLME